MQPRTPSTNVVRHGGPATCRPANHHATTLAAHVIFDRPAAFAWRERFGDVGVISGRRRRAIAWPRQTRSGTIRATSDSWRSRSPEGDVWVAETGRSLAWQTDRPGPKPADAWSVAVALVRSGAGRQANAIARTGPVGGALIAGCRAQVDPCKIEGLHMQSRLATFRRQTRSPAQEPGRTDWDLADALTPRRDGRRMIAIARGAAWRTAMIGRSAGPCRACASLFLVARQGPKAAIVVYAKQLPPRCPSRLATTNSGDVLGNRCAGARWSGLHFALVSTGSCSTLATR